MIFDLMDAVGVGMIPPGSKALILKATHGGGGDTEMLEEFECSTKDGDSLMGEGSGSAAVKCVRMTQLFNPSTGMTKSSS